MSELEKIVLTSGLTIIGGIIIFVVGQLINEIVIKPYLNYKKIIGKIDEELVFTSNIYMNPGIHNNGSELAQKASENLRRLASDWGASYRRISNRYLFQKFKRVVTEDEKDKIESNLIGLSNSLWTGDSLDINDKRSSEIRKLLRI